MEKDIKYIILEKHDILNGIKYKVGKRYKLDKFNGIEIYGNVSDINFLSYSFRWSIENVDIYEIGAYQTLERIDMYEDTDRVLYATDFKILKKINYKTLNRDKECLAKRNEYFLYGYKNRDDEIIEEMFLELSKQEQSKAEQYSLIASLKIEKHIKTLRKINRNDAWLAWLTLNRNKDLDKLAKSRYAVEKIAVAQVGRPQDLDILINDNDEDVVRTVLSNGRKKDLEKYIKNPTQEIKEGIFEAGIDKYLDLLEKNNKDSETFIERTKSIRKKDLDYYLRLGDDVYLRGIIAHGFDKHLDIIIKKEIGFTFAWILKFGRQRDIEFLIKQGYNINDYI